MSGDEGHRTVATNRKARHEYDILETLEAGLVLKGPEVKSLRDGRASFQDAYARLERGEVWLEGVHISPYEQANRFNVDPVRPRKLLLHREEIRRLVGKVEEKGLTLVPLKIYFSRGHAKVTIALARGRKLHDKREAIKRRDHERETRRAVREARRGSDG